MKKRYIFLSLIAIIGISVMVCPRGIDNTIALLLENNYFVPKECNICVFRGIVFNGGSGEGWLYGEDNNYYYMLNVDYESKSDPSYFILKKEQEASNIEKFDPIKPMEKDIKKLHTGEILHLDFNDNTKHIRSEFIKRGEGKFRNMSNNSEKTKSDTFDSKLWKETRIGENVSKHWMLPSLEKHLYIGMPRSEVRDLLGVPEVFVCDRDTYSLGTPPFIGIDDEVYVFMYDEANYVVSIHISNY